MQPDLDRDEVVGEGGVVKVGWHGVVEVERVALKAEFRSAVLPSWFLVYQNVLLPFAGFFIGAMNAACPTARTFSTFEQFIYRSTYAACASFFLFCLLNPADEFVSGDWRQRFPKADNLFCFGQRLDQIGGQWVYKTA